MKLPLRRICAEHELEVMDCLACPVDLHAVTEWIVVDADDRVIASASIDDPEIALPKRPALYLGRENHKPTPIDTRRYRFVVERSDARGEE